MSFPPPPPSNLSHASYDMPGLVDNHDNIIHQVGYIAPNQPQDFIRHYIPFKLDTSARLGIRLSQADDAAVLRHLEKADEPLPIPMRAKMSIRVQPEGCASSFGLQKHVRRLVRGRPVVITHAQTVGLVAEVMRAFIDDQARRQTQEGIYQFGPGAIELEDLVLVAIEQVSVASLQPVLEVRARDLV